MMKTKQRVESPVILGELRLDPSTVLLTSIVDTEVTVETTGQKVENHNFEGSEFNHEWTSE